MVDWGLIVVQFKKNENEKQEEKHENSEDSRLHSILQYFTSAGLVHQVQVQSVAGHAPLICIGKAYSPQQISFSSLVQLPSASSVPGSGRVVKR